MATKMTPAEAARHLKPMKTVFRAFEHLEDVLTAAAQAEDAIPRAQKRLKDIEDSIAKAGAAKEGAEAAAKAAERQAEQDRAQFAAQHEGQVKDRHATLAALDKDIAELEETRQAREAQSRDTIADCEAREAAALQKTEAAEAALEALGRRVSAAAAG